jgi:hypothetical protein
MLVRKPEGKRPLGRPICRWVEHNKIDFREVEWGCIDSIDLAQDWDQWRALVNTVINFRVAQNVGKFLSSCTTIGFSRTAHLHEVNYYYYYYHYYYH